MSDGKAANKTPKLCNCGKAQEACVCKTQEDKKLKPCCACPETREARDKW